MKNFSWKQNFLPLSDVVRYVTDEMLFLIYGKFSVIEICFVKFSEKLLIIHNKNTKKINVQYDSWIWENLADFLAHLLKK